MRAAFLVALVFATTVSAGQPGGFIAGAVRDRSGAVVPGAEIQVQNEWTGARKKTYSAGEGRYETSALPDGTYKVTARKRGFRTITRSGRVAVAAAKTRLIDFELDVLPVQQEVTVEGTRDQTQTDPTMDGLSLSRQSSATALPANGRDLHALFSMMPGAVVTPASIGDGGQFTVSGQRPNTNSFRVDGVSANGSRNERGSRFVPRIYTARDDCYRKHVESFFQGRNRPGRVALVRLRPAVR